MSLQIPQTIRDTIIDHARRDTPIEACGYLAGTNGAIVKAYTMHNADQSAEHYSFVPEEQFKVLKQARADGLQLLAAYHSHPASPARMSDEDIRLALDPNISYIIVSLQQEEPVINSFRVSKGEVTPEEITGA